MYVLTNEVIMQCNMLLLLQRLLMLLFKAKLGHLSTELDSLCMYTVSQKIPTFELSVTLSNLNQFSKLLHCWNAVRV